MPEMWALQLNSWIGKFVLDISIQYNLDFIVFKTLYYAYHDYLRYFSLYN